ncbi:hypothetical protein M413DRAFT_447112 [Hebeloma cylindrosporum]|uniref:Uncharacterized protein n=1 Tax=Hebeloma cylindrosporum TaxID=76867 RepID=A0A0C3C600_HEBCY|nr:hypothetical protein M413DRAFT_447112 [Hebeloma cylindrosporum h7]
MIAKFHSAPGHSMETTLTINIPPVNSVRGVRSEREREKERLKDMEWERHKEVKEQEKEKERKMKDKERERERDKEKERERLMLEQDRAHRAQGERSVSYKDKFQRMREKYDRVTAAHEAGQKDLEILNAKLKKLQSENDLLLDAIYVADAPLYERYFPSQPGTSSPPLNPSMALPVPNSLPLPPPRLPDLPGPSQSVSSSHYSPSSMAPPRSMAPPISVVSSSSTGRAGPTGLPNLPSPLPAIPPSSASSTMPPPLSIASNGTATSNGTPTGRGQSRRLSSASSTRTSRRRNDVVVSPEDIVVDSPEANTLPESSMSVEMTNEQSIPYSSPRLNGNATRFSPRPDIPISNAIEHASAVRHSPEHSPDEHESENDADHRGDPVVRDAHSDSEAGDVPREVEEEEMDVDKEA